MAFTISFMVLLNRVLTLAEPSDILTVAFSIAFVVLLFGRRVYSEQDYIVNAVTNGSYIN